MSRDKKKRKERRDRKKRRALQGLRDRVSQAFEDDGKSITLGSTSDGVKMSVVLEKFVEPYQEHATNEDEYRTLLTTALVAWNAALLPEDERPALLDELLLKLPYDSRAAGREIVDDLIARKQQSFPQYKRFILDFELVELGDRNQLYVISTPGPI